MAPHRVLLAAVLAVAAFLRFYSLASVPAGLWRDEAVDGADAITAIETHHFDVFYPEDNGREGLYVDVAAPLIAVLGHTAWALRLPAAIFGLLTVLGVYFLGAEAFSVPVGLLAAFFVATSFWHVLFSRTAFRAIAAPFFLVWSIYLLFLGVRKLRERRGFLVWMGFAGVVYGLGFYTYLAYRITPVLVALMLLLSYFQARREGSGRNFLKGVAVFLVAVALTVTPLAVYFIRYPADFSARIDQVSELHSPHAGSVLANSFLKTLGMLYTQGDANWRHNDPGRPEIYWPVAALMTLGLWISIRRGFSGGKGGYRPSFLLLPIWLFVCTIPVFLSDANSVPHAMRGILMVPPVFLLAGIGAWSVYEALSRVTPRRLVTVAGLVFLMALTGEAAHAYFVRWAGNPALPQYFDSAEAMVAEEIESLPADTPKVVAVTSGDRSFHQLPLRVATIMYLTGTMSRRDQDKAHIRYYTPESFDLPVSPALYGLDFCEQVAATLTKDRVFCMR